MTITTLILDPGTNGQAQVKPNNYPSQVVITFIPEGDAQAFYGVNGQRPSIPLQPGQTPVLIEINNLQLQYRVNSKQAKLQWNVQ